MKCEVCHQEEATVHLTQVVNGEVKKVHLCEGCAKDSGVQFGVPSSISDILMGVGQQVQSTRRATSQVCPVCGMNRAEFKKTGRLGCETCYEAFEADLKPLLRAMHHADRHQGKVPAHLSRTLVREKEMADLQQQLDDAIRDERFEEAASLRDRIRKLQSGAPADTVEGA